MLVRTPATVTAPAVLDTSRSSAPVTSNVVALPVELVRPVAEDLGEGVGAGRHQGRVGDPGSVEAGPASRDLSAVVFSSAAAVASGSALLGTKAAIPPIACAPRAWQVLTSRLGVRGHERGGHGHLAAVGQQVVAVLGEVLDHREDVVPAAGVEPGGVVPQLVEDLLHLECRRGGLDQAGRPDGAVRDLQPLLGEGEDVVPQPRLEVGLHLGQVEVRPGAVGDQGLGVVEEVQAEVDEATPGTGRPSSVRWCSSRCQPRGRTMIVGVSAPPRSACPSRR